MIEGKRVLITGGAGFMGAHLALRLADRNQVKIVDLDVHHNAIGYTSLADHSNIELVQGDVCDAQVALQRLVHCDIIVHLAALLGVQNVVDNVRRTIETIVLGTRNCLEACSQNEPGSLFVNVSTSEIYGDTTPFGEAAPASIGPGSDPRMSYAAAKFLAEHLAWSYHRDLGLRVVNVRPFNVFGPYRRTSNAVGVFIVRALAGEDLLIHGSGGQLRSWCYIDDFTDGLVACLQCEAAIGEDINLGNSLTTCTVYDLAQRIIRLTGSRSRIHFVDHPFSDINVRAPNGDKAARLLNYQPQVDMDEGLTMTIEWYQNHLDDFRCWL